MITNNESARLFAQSIATLAIAVQDAIDTHRWEDASNALEDIAADVEKVTAYVNAKITALNEEA